MAASNLIFMGLPVLIGMLLLAGCLPIPTVPHGLEPVPDQEAVDSLSPGVSTRADVLLLLGEPKHRLDDDRFFLYEWDVAYGYVIVGGYTQAYPVPVAGPQYLCFEFGPDSRVVHREHLIGSLYAKPDKAIRKCMKLLEEPDESGKK
jgi:hypothetical protein